MTYIEREVLISHIAGVKSHLYGDSDWITGYRDGLQAACEVIQIFHAANTEPLKCGKWIEKVMVCPWDKDDVDVLYACSICNDVFIGETPYCPSCGARMVWEIK